MKQTFTYSLLVIAALGFTACQSNQQSSETTKPTDTTEILATRPSSEPEAAPSDWLEKLAGTDGGMFRGINLGDAVSVVKEKESAELFEEDATHLGYTLEYENLETVDIQYFLDPNKKVVNQIVVDIYLNNRKSVDEHAKELAAYFSRRYGTATQQSWKISGDNRVSLKDVSKGKDFGLKLTFGNSVQV